ncbi:MAG TPA: hypothetical protein DCQ83_02490 [Fibrobacteres bacterium]|nr:hypothetical protein [Fibrobacterota bacterium]
MAAAAQTDTSNSTPKKSEGWAYTWATIGTLPFVFGIGEIISSDKGEGYRTFKDNLGFFGGALIGPSLGQFYAGSIGTGFGGILIRAVGAGSFSYIVLSKLDGGHEGEDYTVHYILSGFYAAGTIYSLIDTHYAVRRANETHNAMQIGFAPTLLPTSDGLKPGAIAWAKF